ncbi:MAG: TetR/AcrR family transcriptional regulator [Flavobacteriales bacterium]
MNLVDRFQIPVLSQIALRDPQTTNLGKRIIDCSIVLFDDLGFEHFTFKKLAQVAGTTEASVYRYFSSKQKLLLYLVNWYWGRLECKLLLEAQADNPRDRLEKSLQIVLNSKTTDLASSNERRLQRIVIHEAPKVFLTKVVDSDHEIGYHQTYADVVDFMATLIKAYKPNCQYAQMLVTTILEGSLQQRFFAQHLPEVTNSSEQEDAVAVFYRQLLFNFLDHE